MVEEGNDKRSKHFIRAKEEVRRHWNGGVGDVKRDRDGESVRRGVHAYACITSPSVHTKLLI
jgi:hypothetical protein